MFPVSESVREKVFSPDRTVIRYIFHGIYFLYLKAKRALDARRINDILNQYQSKFVICIRKPVKKWCNSVFLPLVLFTFIGLL